MTLEERLARIEQALFGSYEPERAFLLEYEGALKELLKGNRKPLEELKNKYGNITNHRRIEK